MTKNKNKNKNKKNNINNNNSISDNSTTNDNTDSNTNTNTNAKSTDKHRIIVIGAGISGIVMATYLQTQLKCSDFIIIESRNDIGGTWLVNKYPGAACDVESHLYSLYSDLNSNWSINFAGNEEIHDYWLNVVKRHNIREKIKFNTTVKSAQFNENISKWELEVNEQDKDQAIKMECDILIGGVGYLRVPNKPEIFKNFKGPMMHSAEWDPKINLEDKVVGIVGSGASAVQIVPSIIDKVKELHSFQRNPPWVIPRLKSNYSSIFKFLLSWLPGFNKLVYWLILVSNDCILYPAFLNNSLISKVFGFICKSLIQWNIKDPIKKELMIPKYAVGCKRATPSDTYYKAINSPKLSLNDGNIDHIEDNIIYTKDGNFKQVDVLILATGFKTNSPYSEINIKNLKGDHIDKPFNTPGLVPSLKFGITHSKMPNFFQLYGPTTNLGHSSIIFMLECQASYIIKLIRKMERYSIKTIELKEQVGEDYWYWVQNCMKSTSWSSDANSWYKNSNGEVIANWPNTCLSYYLKTLKVNLNDYNCTHC